MGGRLPESWYGKVPLKRISVHLGRSASAVSQHALVLGIRKKRSPKIKQNKYRLISAGVNYKYVLPEESWPQIEHFLASFCKYALVAEVAKRKIDVSLFLKEYVKAYG